MERAGDTAPHRQLHIDVAVRTRKDACYDKRAPYLFFRGSSVEEVHCTLPYYPILPYYRITVPCCRVTVLQYEQKNRLLKKAKVQCTL